MKQKLHLFIMTTVMLVSLGCLLTVQNLLSNLWVGNTHGGIGH